MPFTVSHVAAVLPLRRLGALPFAGLAVGAMSPDLDYLFRVGPGRSYSHSLLGVLTLDLALALVTLGIAMLASPAIAALTPRRWPEVSAWFLHWRPPWSTPVDLARLVVAILIGALSHLFIDGFTHGDAWAVDLLPVLDRSIELPGRTLPLYRCLQYGLSVVGLGLLAGSALRWFRATRRTSPSGGEAPVEGWIEPEQALVLALFAAVTVAAAAQQTAAGLNNPGLDRATAVMLLLGTWRAAGLVLVGMGTMARGLSVLGATPSR